MLRRQTPSSAQLTGGDLSVDVLHTEDSVRPGDGTNLIGPFVSASGGYAMPTYERNTAHFTDGSQKTLLTDASANVGEFDDVGGEKALKVSVIASVGGGGGGTAATDSAAFTAGATQGTPLMGAYDDVSPDALAEGEMGIARMTSARALHVELQNSSVAVTGTFWQATQPVSIASMPATPVTDNGGSLTVDGTVSVTGVSTLAEQQTQTTHLATLAGAVTASKVQAEITNTPTVTVGNASLAVTGTFWQATQPVSGTFWQATQPVSIAAAVAVNDNGGSLTVDGTVAATQSGTWNVNTVSTVTTLTSITNAVTVVGNAAHDAAASGNPVMIAGRANNANPTEVAAGDASYVMTDLSGRVVTTKSPRALVTHNTGSQSTTTEATILSAGGAGVFHDLTQLIFTNSSSTDAAQVQIRDATAGTIRFEHVIPTNSGMVVQFDPPLNQATANNNWTIDLNAAVSTVYWTVQAVKRT